MSHDSQNSLVFNLIFFFWLVFWFLAILTIITFSFWTKFVFKNLRRNLFYFLFLISYYLISVRLHIFAIINRSKQKCQLSFSRTLILTIFCWRFITRWLSGFLTRWLLRATSLNFAFLNLNYFLFTTDRLFFLFTGLWFFRTTTHFLLFLISNCFYFFLIILF